MFNIREYKDRTSHLSDLLPWAALIDKGVVLNKNGSFQKTIRFRGPDIESSTDTELVALCAQLNNALKRLGSGWAFFVEARRHKSSDYPEANFQDNISLLIDEERRTFFSDYGVTYESDYYFTFVYLPPSEGALKAQSKFIENSAASDSSTNYERTLEQFKERIIGISDIFRGFMPGVEMLNDNETLTYLHSTISTKIHPVTTSDAPMYLDAILPDMSLKGGLEPMLGESYIKTITVKSFPALSFPAILDELNALPIEYRWVNRFIALDKLDAVKELTTYKRQWFAKRKGIVTMLRELATSSESIMQDNDAVQKSVDSDEALQEVSDDLVSYGYYTATVTVWDTDPVKVEEKTKMVEQIINSRGFVTQNEKANAVQAWLGSLPGHCNANVRRPLMNSLNLAHMMPMSAVWPGPEKNVHLKDAALFQAVTSGHTPFRFVNHVGDVGHMMILGPTGAGKSVLLSFMAVQFRRYKDAQVYIFDKGGSAKIMTLAVGGHHYNLCGEERALAFQPLSQIDNESERSWASEWLIEIFTQEKIEITPAIKSEIWDALSSLATAPVKQRTITGLVALLQNTALREALMPYTIRGAHGDLLDADNDTLSEGTWQCFEMEELMNRPTVVAPVLSYLFHRLEARFTGNPTLLVLDEAWLFLDNPIFAAKIREWLKVLRKANVSVIFATQSVADAASSSIATALIESCLTRVFLPNGRAMEEDSREFYERFGLNSRKISILATSTPKKHYYFQSALGNRLFELGLGPVALAFCASSSKKDQQHAETLVQKQLEEQEFAVAFLRYKKLDWAADMLDQVSTQPEKIEERHAA